MKVVSVILTEESNVFLHFCDRQKVMGLSYFVRPLAIFMTSYHDRFFQVSINCREVQ